MRLHRHTFSGDLDRRDYQSPVGMLGLLASEQGLRAILFPKDLTDSSCRASFDKARPSLDNYHLQLAVQQLDGYFAGTLRTFDLDLDLQGTDFQKSVWHVLAQIPYGAIYTYKQQAECLGAANKSRAVGMANGKNPISIVVPCHRVVGSNGKLTGYAGGLETKRFLLDQERALFDNSLEVELS